MHASESDIPAEALLDPVANTLDLRQPFTKERAARVHAAMKATGVGLSDVSYFDNMLHPDPAIRKKKYDFMYRVFDAAALLGTDAVCGFVGRNYEIDMDPNLDMFEECFIPLLKEAKARGLVGVLKDIAPPSWAAIRTRFLAGTLHVLRHTWITFKVSCNVLLSSSALNL